MPKANGIDIIYSSIENSCKHVSIKNENFLFDTASFRIYFNM